MTSVTRLIIVKSCTAAGAIALVAVCMARPAFAQAAIAVGDMVQTGVNGQTVVGEVTRSAGATVDLNLGQNNVSRFVQIANVKVLQRAGAGGKAACAVGDAVQVPYLAGTVFTAKIMKTNGAYCEVDSSGSGFTGWQQCADIRRGASGASCGPAIAPGARGNAAATSAGQPPRPGLVSCAGKIEGRYAASSGLGNFTIEFRAGKATMKAPLVGDEETECWMSGKKIFLHMPGQAEDIPLDINNDGTIDTPFGEIKKKGD
jgi:hypothetical protein